MSNGPKILWCEKHGKKGGTINCLTCTCEELNRALSRIDYMLGPSNEMELSDYDVHCDPELVVERVRRFIYPQSVSKVPILTKSGHDFAAMVRDQAGHTCEGTTADYSHPPCLMCQQELKVRE